jgi:diguanylate cyclase (GGDEF)-like protein
VVDQGVEAHIPLSALRPVYRALTGVNTAIGLDSTLQAIADGVAGCTPFRNASVNVIRDDGDFHCLAVAGPVELSETLLGRVCARRTVEKLLDGAEPWGAMWLLRDAPVEAGADAGLHASAAGQRQGTVAGPGAQLPSYGLLALMRDAGSELVGMLYLDDPQDGLMPPPWVGDVLEMFAEQAAIAILNARRHDEAMNRMECLERESEALRFDIEERRRRELHLRHQARHDALTGLANPVELTERLVGLLADQIPMAVIFCDLDRFKEVNDTKGHAVGDSVLRLVAERLRAAVRGEDVVARVGGDEFVVVAAGIGSDDALALVDRIDQAFAHPMAVGETTLLVRASLGLAYEPARPENALAPDARARELLGSADREMYARKRARASFTRLTSRAWARRASVAG